MSVPAREYHERTKHTPASVRDGHRLDFSNQPRPTKQYVDLPTRPLADRIRPPQVPLLSAIATTGADGARSDPPDRETVTQLCYFAAGITRQVQRRGGVKHFRAAACTGALYHVDLYLVCGDLPGLPAGVYHFEPTTLSLDVLRQGDFRSVLAAATHYRGVADAPLSVVTTSTWWRNAWKYRDRTYRHAFWDSGTTLANLLATAHALDFRAEAVLGFADEPVAELLGVDTDREAPLEIVPVGSDDPVPGADRNHPPDVPPIDPETEPLSATEPEFPLIQDAYAASSLPDGETATAWRSPPVERVGRADPGDGERISLDPVGPDTMAKTPLDVTVRRRGSAREYDREPISFRKLSTVLDRGVRGTPLDVRAPDAPPLALGDAYLAVHAVDGLESGLYHYLPERGELERLASGDFRRETGHAALDQALAADAAAVLFVLADLDAVVDHLGDRGYRAAQFEASLTAGRCWLGAYAHRDLGATGLTFYDDVVTDLFAPRSADQTPMFCWTVGKPA